MRRVDPGAAVRWAAACGLAMLAACRPPAADHYVTRVELQPASGDAHVLMHSPDTTGAIWAGTASPDRLLYGKPGETPLMALECAGEGTLRSLVVTRFAQADAHAKAMLALIGNGHVSRFKVDSTWNGRGWLWQGRIAPGDPLLDVLTGQREVEATIPGAGTLKLNPSSRPAELIERCRRLVAPAAPPPTPGASPSPAAIEPLGQE
jgi:hypothetical protein